MTQYLNPAAVGDYSGAGLSSGTATDSLVFTAGLAMDPETLRKRADAVTVADEVRIAFENIDHVLGEAGLTRRDIVKTTCYLAHDEHRFDFIPAYKEAFGDGPYPARCTFVVGLAADLNVQIDVIAVRPERG
ncbi:RidA family protein [Nocardioides sp. AE5]|uniref:RidA family protein n=1 Tax=Nocardioides sp. AE5 TaxID=2962573 RepID=UPI0028813DF4|nr:RidA family protein [Nocardioides sp. AE5]MDT0203047.1 RidA family protein [Nocardioides sp. AE5]